MFSFYTQKIEAYQSDRRTTQGGQRLAGQADTFFINVEDGNNRIGATSNFNDPLNPFNKMWRAINPDKSAELNKQLKDARAKLWKARHTRSSGGGLWSSVGDFFKGGRSGESNRANFR